MGPTIFIYFIYDLCHMTFFGNIEPKTEMIIFVKFLLKSNIEIDDFKKLNNIYSLNY